MSQDKDERHLSRISTIWTELRNAHGEDARAATAAHQRLVNRYSESVYAYLRGIVRDPDVADELFQQFALALLTGRFKGAQPGRGRFRDYVKATLRNLVARHHNSAKRRKESPAELENLPVAQLGADIDKELDRSLIAGARDELLEVAWKRLLDEQGTSGTPYFDALRLRAECPDARSADLATTLNASRADAQPLSSSGVRQILKRARDKFAKALLAEAQTLLETDSREYLEQELIELDLHRYCKSELRGDGSQARE